MRSGQKIPILAVFLSAMALGAAVLWRNRSEKPSNASDPSAPLPRVEFRQILAKRPSIRAKPVPEPLTNIIESLLQKSTQGNEIDPEEVTPLSDKWVGESTPAWFVHRQDVDGNGDLELIVKRYWLGTGRVYSLWIYQQRDVGFSCFHFRGGDRGCYYAEMFDKIDSWGFIHPESQIEDLDGDGIPEIIVPNVLSERGAGTVANWPSIYRLRNGEFTSADERFSSFYRERYLPHLPANHSDPVSRKEVEALHFLVQQMEAHQ